MREPLWSWIDDFYWRAIHHGDAQRQRLAQQHYTAWQLMESQPEQALTLLNDGIALANQLEENWWALFYDYWRTEAWVFYLRNLNQGLDNAVRCAVECHKPLYDEFPGRARVYRVLVDAYVFRDPIGYEDKIREILRMMHDDMPLDSDTRLLLQARYAQLDAIFGNLAGAIDKTQAYLNASQHSDFRMMHAYDMLCYYAYLSGDLDLAEAYSENVEACSRKCGRKSGVMASFLFRALKHRIQGNESSARSFYARYTAARQHLSMKRTAVGYDLLCKYHELGGDTATALALRDEQLTELADKGYYHDEAWCHLRRLQLLNRMGRPLHDELEATEAAIARLLKPERFTQAMQRIAAGDTSDKMLF